MHSVAQKCCFARSFPKWNFFVTVLTTLNLARKLLPLKVKFPIHPTYTKTQNMGSFTASPVFAMALKFIGELMTFI